MHPCRFDRSDRIGIETLPEHRVDLELPPELRQVAVCRPARFRPRIPQAPVEKDSLRPGDPALGSRTKRPQQVRESRITMSIRGHVNQDARAAKILPQHSQHAIPACARLGQELGYGDPILPSKRWRSFLRQRECGLRSSRTASPEPRRSSSQPVPRASRQRAGQGKPVGSAGRSRGRRAASSGNEPGRSYDTHEHLLKYVLSIVLAEPKTADGDRIDIARGPLDELVPRLRLARAAAMDKLASLSSPAIASESTPSIRRAAAANRSRPLATALEHGRGLRAKYV